MINNQQEWCTGAQGFVDVDINKKIDEAKAGDGASAVVLGMAYMDGSDGVEVDLEEACYWFSVGRALNQINGESAFIDQLRARGLAEEQINLIKEKAKNR